MYKVCLMGASFDTGNQGVSALAASLLGIIGRIRPEARFSFFIGGRRSQKREIKISGRKVEYEIIHYRLSPKAALREHLFFIFAMACLQRLLPFSRLKTRVINAVPVLRALQEADFIGDIRGGDSFSDLYGMRRAVLGSMPGAVALLLRKPLVLLPQTYGPYQSWMARSVARWILGRAACILARDKEGVDLVKTMLKRSGGRDAVRFCPDVAFHLEGKVPEKPAVNPPLPAGSSGNLLAGLNVNGLLFNGGYSRNNMFGLRLDYREFVQKLAQRFLGETPAHLLLVPHTFAPKGHVESDPEACRAVFEALRSEYRERIHLLEGAYDPFEIKGIIGGCDFFVGSRMHACIAAVSQGIPTVGVAYSKKFRGIFQSVGMENMVLDARSLDTNEGISKVMQLFERRRETGRMLSRNIPKVHAELEETFRSLLV